MIVQQTATDRIASRLLTQYGIAFIWDTHVAAAAAYGLGKLSIAKDLTDIAEAAEAAWLARTKTSLFPTATTHRDSSHG